MIVTESIIIIFYFLLNLQLYEREMIQMCGTRFGVRWIYLQIYISLILLCCAVFFLVQLLYCQSQIDLINQFQLGRYACSDICRNYPFSLGTLVCCTDGSYSNCNEKYYCLEPTINIFADKQNKNGLTMACLVTAVPFLVLVHLAIRIYLKRRRANQRRQNRILGRNQQEQRPGMPSLESFLHHDQENQCSICLEKFQAEKAIVLTCGHIFHNQCIRQWGSRRKTCPVCRTQQ